MPAAKTQSEPSKDLTNGKDVEILKKELPHVDLETGLKHRTVKRDPITGLGTVANGAGDKAARARTQSLGRRTYNSKLISWDADEEPTKTRPSNVRQTKGSMRNPIALTGELGAEVDNLRTTSRLRVGTPREPQRDPIAGIGNFGEKEWDPIWKYNGRVRRSKSSNGVRSNPITGQNLKSFEVMVEEKPVASRRRDQVDAKRNIFTGENCTTFSVSPGMKSPSKKGSISSPRNAITGENCTSYDINSEVHTPKKQNTTKSANPLNGENVNVYTVSQEERQRTPKPYVYKNTVTGENLQSYQIIPIERNITSKPLKERQNPLSGENMKTYKYRYGESELAVKRRDLSSPLTGEGSRGRTYVVSVEERPQTPMSNGTGETQSKTRARSSGPSRNILTGENCETYTVYGEMRSERMKTPLTNGTSASYNILTGS